MAIKHFIKNSDTCECKYIQTHDPSLDGPDGAYNPAAWGSVETFTAPDARVYVTTRCDIHSSIPFTQLNDVLLNKECRLRNLVVKELLKNEKLGTTKPEDLMAKCSFSGDPQERNLDFDISEFSSLEKSTEQEKLRSLFGLKVSIK